MTTKETKNTNSVTIPSAEDMVKAGVHFGHRTSRWNPKMDQYIFTTKNDVHIIDLEKTIEKLNEALSFLKDVASKGGSILFLGTGPSSREIVEKTAQETGMPYVSNRWLGGTITNFKIISKRLEYFRELERKREAGELKKYTKKEQLDFDEELKKLERKFGGIKKMTKLPEALFVLDPVKNDLAIKEANLAKIKIVALCDTNINPMVIDYPIPSNDDAVSALELMAKTAAQAIEEGKAQKQELAEEK